MIAKHDSQRHGVTSYYYWHEDCMCGPYQTIAEATDKFVSALQSSTEYNEPHLLRKALISSSIYLTYINEMEARCTDEGGVIDRQTTIIDNLENEVLSLREQLDEEEAKSQEWRDSYFETKEKIKALKTKYMED